MAYYTLCFKDIYDSFTTGDKWQERVMKTAENIFSFPFPWYNDNSDGSLENFKRIFVESHFTDEIGFETMALFKMQMQRVFYQKIPYYTDLYKALNINYNPLINHEISGKRNGEKKDNENATGKNTNSGKDLSLTENSGSDKISTESKGQSDSENSNTTTDKSTTTVNSSNNNQTLRSDYPQANFTKTKDYASEVNRGQSNDESTNTVNDTVKSDGTGSVKSADSTISTTTLGNKSQNTFTHGHVIDSENQMKHEHEYTDIYSDSGWGGGSKTDELEKYRAAIRNINEMLLHEFDDLFLGLYEPLENNAWYSPLHGY